MFRLFALAVFLAAAAFANKVDIAFVESNQENVWRFGNLWLSKDGIVLASEGKLRRFRWLAESTPSVEAKLKGASSFILDGRTTRPRREAMELIFRWPRSHTIRFYQGARGIEFDIDYIAGSPFSGGILRSLDSDLSIGNHGELQMGGRRLAAVPITEVSSGGQVSVVVPSRYSIRGQRDLYVKLSSAPLDGASVRIDPVLDYSTYWGGSNSESALHLQELEPDLVLIVGHTSTPDLPQAVWLSGRDSDLLSLDRGSCFITLFRPSTGSIVRNSLLGGDGPAACSAVHVDEFRRIWIAGISSGRGFHLPLGTPPYLESQLSSPREGLFILMLSQDAARIEFGAFTGLPSPEFTQPMRASLYLAGPSREPHFAFVCPRQFVTSGAQPPLSFAEFADGGRDAVAVYALNRQSGRFSKRLVWGIPQSVNPTRLRIKPLNDGELHVIAENCGAAIAQVQPVQSVLTGGSTSSVVVAFSNRLDQIVFSTSIGGAIGTTRINEIAQAPAGNLYLAGETVPGAFGNGWPEAPTGLNPQEPMVPFLMEVRPGVMGPLRAASPGALRWVTWPLISYPDERICIRTEARDPHVSSPAFACMSEDWAFQELHSGLEPRRISSANLFAGGSLGTIWVASEETGAQANMVPPSLADHALIAAKPNVVGTNLLIRRHQVFSPPPSLSYPIPVRFQAFQPPFTGRVLMAGKSFSAPMAFHVDGKSVPLRVGSSTRAEMEISPAVAFQPGLYSGRLQTANSASSEFPVEILHMRPVREPVSPASVPQQSTDAFFRIDPPVYAGTTVYVDEVKLENVQLETVDGVGPTLRVRVPGSMLNQAKFIEFKVINPEPGGGVSRQRVPVGNAAQPIEPPPIFQRGSLRVVADGVHRILYSLTRNFAERTWGIEKIDISNGAVVGTAIFASQSTGAANESLIDLELSPKGKLLFALFDNGRVVELDTERLQAIRIFPNAAGRSDRALAGGGFRPGIRVLTESPLTFAVSKFSGEVSIFHERDWAPFDSSFFLSDTRSSLTLLGAIGSAVYALELNVGGSGASGCLLRFEVDNLGLFPPEQFCDLTVDWGKYPEMQTFANRFLLKLNSRTVSLTAILREQGSGATDLIVDPGLTTWALLAFQRFGFSGKPTSRIDFEDLQSGRWLGHWPRDGRYEALAPVALWDDVLVMFGGEAGSTRYIIVPNWREQSEIYP